MKHIIFADVIMNDYDEVHLFKETDVNAKAQDDINMEELKSYGKTKVTKNKIAASSAASKK